jgi:hypothetical protein
MRRAPLLALAALFVLAAPARADVSVSQEGGRVTVRARQAPVGEVLERLRGSVNLIFDASVETRVTLEIEGATPAEAVRRIAAAAGLEVEEAPGPVLLVKKPSHERPAAIVERGGAVYAAPDAFPYPVVVLRDAPEDVTEKARLSRFETTAGVSLVSAPDLKARVMREYLEERPIYRAIAARAGLDAPLGTSIDDRHVRIYFDQAEKRYYAEILLDASGRDLVHLVYTLAGERLTPVSLTIFRKPL